MVLVGAMFMRSNAEIEQARYAVESQQAFWLAEMGVDEVSYGLKVNPPTLEPSQCTKPILRILSTPAAYATSASTFVGTAPLTNGTIGYTAQVCRCRYTPPPLGSSALPSPCLTDTGEYVISAFGVGGTRGTSLVTTLVNVPSNNLKFSRALLATTTITLQQNSMTAAVEQATVLSQGGSFRAPMAALLSNTNIATLAKTSPTTKTDPAGVKIVETE